MIRKFLNSHIELLDMNIVKGFDEQVFFIQSEKITDNLVIFETCMKSEICDLIPFSTMGANNGTIKQNTYSDEKIKEYSEIVLNTDPFYKYSGAKLGAIIEAKDVNWINKALKEMRNEYIRTRIEYLAKAYNLI